MSIRAGWAKQSPGWYRVAGMLGLLLAAAQPGWAQEDADTDIGRPLVGSALVSSSAVESAIAAPAPVDFPSVVPRPVEPATDTPQPVNAVWVQHKVNFTYFAGRTYYSCDGFRNKLRYVLLKLGVLPQSLSIVSNCNDSMGIQALSGARITVALPRELTPELVATIARDASRRELIRRVRGEEPFNLTAAQFPAAWTTVEFDGRRDHHALDGDCDLLSQMTRTLFPPLGVRLAPDSRMRCSQGSIGTIRFKAESLQPVHPPERPAFASKDS
jgi:hypothetical protein